MRGSTMQQGSIKITFVERGERILLLYCLLIPDTRSHFGMNIAKLSRTKSSKEREDFPSPILHSDDFCVSKNNDFAPEVSRAQNVQLRRLNAGRRVSIRMYML